MLVCLKPTPRENSLGIRKDASHSGYCSCLHLSRLPFVSPIIRTLGKALKADVHPVISKFKRTNPAWHTDWMALCSLADAIAGHLNRGYVWDLTVSNRWAGSLKQTTIRAQSI